MPGQWVGTKQVRFLLERIFSLFVPPICGGCKQTGALICAECRLKVVWADGPRCQRCGRPLGRAAAYCWSCRHNTVPLTQIHAAFLYVEPISNIIKTMKYEGAFALAPPLVELMVSRPVQWQNPIDLLIPVPLHPKRQRERGYNQSALLARELSRHWQLSVEERALQRIRHTTPQVGLSNAQRRVNVVGAFQADPQQIQHKHVLLIDDVYTTGATLSAAAVALHAAGASSIAAYCVARTR